MKFNNSVSHSLTALARLANAGPNAQMNCTQLCEGTGLPARFVLQLLRELVNREVIISQRGVHGGYMLARPASKITLLEIVEAVDGPIGVGKRLPLEGITAKSVGAVENALAAIADDTRKRLASITLADLRAAKAA